jgi:hypothetical protein
MNGTVMAWGNNSKGQLGNGTTADSDVPVQVSGLSGVTAISTGDDGSLALLSNGTVMAWGSNEAGELGDGSTTGPEECYLHTPCSTRPVPVSGLSEVTAIAGGYDHSLALLKNGTVMAWGQNWVGQLGDGGSGLEASSDVPVPVSGLDGVTAIAASGLDSLALISDGAVMAWGENSNGQLGNGSKADSDVPVAVNGLSEATAIASGPDDSLALLSNGTAMAWGGNKWGQLGDGTKARSDVPVAVSGLSEATAIASGESEDSLALLKDGRVMAWGEGGAGALGNGTETGSDVPIAVSGLGGVTAISAGWHSGLAISSLPTVTAVEPNMGPFVGGTSVSITGINFTGATMVKFGSSRASKFTVRSPTLITATSPPGTGVVEVTVTTPQGASPARLADRFSHEPIVNEVQPNFGRPAGGASVTITGANFNRATAVRFGSRRATRFVVHSPTSIMAVAPPGTGTVDVTVATPGGVSTASSADLFTYTNLGEWAIFPTPSLGSSGNSLAGISCLSARFCMAAGNDNLSGEEVLIEEWNGTAWSKVAAPQPPAPAEGIDSGIGLGGVSCASAKFCVAVGSGYFTGPDSPHNQGAFAILDTWNGAAWSESEPELGGGDNTLGGVSCVSSSFCVAVGSSTRVGEGERPSEALVASWNGAAWSRVPVISPGFSAELGSVSCVSIKFCMAVGGSDNERSAPLNESLVESWNGAEWSNVSSPNIGRLRAVSCTDADRCVAVGGSQVAAWNGNTWSTLEGPHLEGGGLAGVSCVGKSCAGVGAYEARGQAHTLVETPNGSAWSIVPSASSVSGGTELNDVSCISARSCFAVGQDDAGPGQTLVEAGGLQSRGGSGFTRFR